jgi:hypothetical protein
MQLNDEFSDDFSQVSGWKGLGGAARGPGCPDPHRAPAGVVHPQAVEIIPGRFYATALKRPESLSRSAIACSSLCYCIDHDLVRGAARGVAWHGMGAAGGGARSWRSECARHDGGRTLGAAAPRQAPPPRARLTQAPHAPRALPPQLYEPFYADFGPLNLGRTYRFCQITARLLKVGARAHTRGGGGGLPARRTRAAAALSIPRHLGRVDNTFNRPVSLCRRSPGGQAARKARLPVLR